MFVLRPVRLDEADRRELSLAGGGEERGLVLEVVAGVLAGARVDVSGGVPGEVVEGLVVVLEQRAGMPGRRVVPAAGVPGPADVPLGQLVADRAAVVRRGRVDVVDQRQRVRAARAGRAGRLDGVDRVVAAGEAGSSGAGLGEGSVVECRVAGVQGVRPDAGARGGWV